MTTKLNLSTEEKQAVDEMMSGKWYAADNPVIVNLLRHCQQVCFEINAIPPKDMALRNDRIAALLGAVGKGLQVNTPFNCDYGFNIHVGENFFANFNLVILDEAEVTFGNNVFIGPNCSFYTAAHPLDTERRDANIEKALPITVGDSVWFGGNVTVLPGVTIGSHTTIGAGSVVTHDIPGHVVAVGNPCHVIRQL